MFKQCSHLLTKVLPFMFLYLIEMPEMYVPKYLPLCRKVMQRHSNNSFDVKYFSMSS